MDSYFSIASQTEARMAKDITGGSQDLSEAYIISLGTEQKDECGRKLS
jgi:hypothetical protein